MSDHHAPVFTEARLEAFFDACKDHDVPRIRGPVKQLPLYL
ncbi:MAG: hypothetical protein WD156_02620 [Acidimicrobiia bacterium]